MRIVLVLAAVAVIAMATKNSCDKSDVVCHWVRVVCACLFGKKEGLPAVNKNCTNTTHTLNLSSLPHTGALQDQVWQDIRDT